MNENLYTQGESFRAQAEVKAVDYRNSVLQIYDYDTYSHILTDEEAANGSNFLASEKEFIKSELSRRNQNGKGVGMRRTTKNMLSSQAMCFNLFAPLNRDKDYAVLFFDQLLKNVKSISDDIQYEYTPNNSIFKDQSVKGGVDCDAMLTYTTKDNELALITIETKYVEPEFSTCSFRKPKKDKKSKEIIENYHCPVDTIVTKDFSNCRYHFKKKFRYWEIAQESGLYKMDVIWSHPCAFRDELWQLWTNMSLAYAVAKERGIKDFKFAVICPKANRKLSNNGEVYSQFRELLIEPDKFIVIFLQDIKEAFDKIGSTEWSDDFVQRYCW